jgi:transcriptional regulator with XRE-family HTH domain
MSQSRMYHWGRGLELRLAREELGLSMDEFADALRVGRRTVQRWEGDIDPIGESIWDEVAALTARLDAEMDVTVGIILSQVEIADYPPFWAVEARHLRQRLAAVEAQAELNKNEIKTRLVTAAGLKAIEEYGYEDPITV